jgi:hypothetical protein
MTNASQMNQINEVGGLHVSAQYLLLRYIWIVHVKECYSWASPYF